MRYVNAKQRLVESTAELATFTEEFERIRSVVSVRWAVGEYVDHATRQSRIEQLRDASVIDTVCICGLFEACHPNQRLDPDFLEAGERGDALRVMRAVRHWQAGGFMDPPVIYLAGENLVFLDGRHRLVAAYQLGVTEAPVLVPICDRDKIRLRLGGTR